MVQDGLTLKEPEDPDRRDRAGKAGLGHWAGQGRGQDLHRTDALCARQAAPWGGGLPALSGV